jgi:DNA helicase IV
LDDEFASEQRYVDRLYALVDLLRDRARRALDEVRRSPFVPTPAGRTERDAFDALHSGRLRRLTAVEERLVFGRLDLTDGRIRYIGRIGLSDDDRTQLLLDWRAPAAAAFYQATAAEPNGVIRRRHLALKGRTVSTLDDEVLDSDALSQDPRGMSAVAGQGALMAALTARRTGRMRDIVATLQAEQDRIVRSELPGMLVVQGGPGTGKTAVALHRAAYLLYTHRDRISGSGVLVVGPGTAFLRYIEQVLPSLGETGVVLLTPGLLVPGIAADRDDPDEVAVLKGDLRMASVIRTAVRSRQRRLAAPLTVDVDGSSVTLTPEVVAEARTRARQTGRTHNEARVTFVQHVLEDLADRLARARGVPDRAERPELLAELRSTVAVRREINLLWMPLTATGLLADLFARPDRLAPAAEKLLSRAEQSLLHRPKDAPWTVSDVPLLDEAAELIGPEAGELTASRAAAARLEAERAEAVSFAGDVLRESGAAADMVSAQMLADRFADSGPDSSVAERAGQDRGWVFGHAVVDEAQELSPMQWRVIIRRVPSRSMTVVGDVAQTGSAAGVSSWEQALEPHASGLWRVAELTVNYRTPRAVMELATALLSAHGVPAPTIRSARDGQWEPRRLPVPDDGSGSLVTTVRDALTEDDRALGGAGRSAVLVPRGMLTEMQSSLPTAIADPDLRDRVSVLEVRAAKGLEFDAVTVVEPGRILTESSRGVHDLYVALTRPTERLTLVHSEPLPAGLDRVRRSGPR